MARNRTISPDFWTWENVIDCKPMTRLLFIGLWNFADDGGVQPLKPRTIRLQVLPGDGIDDETVRAMLDELAAQGLVRLYSVEGQDYVAIVDWEQLQRVGKRARRRYPPYPSPHAGEKAPSANEADEGLPHAPLSPPEPSAAPDVAEEKDRWRAAIAARLRQTWPNSPPIDAVEPAATERWIEQSIEGGYDLDRDVLAAMNEHAGPPTRLNDLIVAVEVNRDRHKASLRQAAESMQAAA